MAQLHVHKQGHATPTRWHREDNNVYGAPAPYTEAAYTEHMYMQRLSGNQNLPNILRTNTFHFTLSLACSKLIKVFAGGDAQTEKEEKR